MPPIHPAMKQFMLADRYAVLGRVMTAPSRYDHKVYKWYTARGLPVTPVKHEAREGEQVDGVELLSDVHAIPDLSKTSISIIINPTLGLPILKSLYPSSQAGSAHQSPHAVWFQPGAADDHIKAYVEERGLEGKVVLEGCVLVSGDKAREEAGVMSASGHGRGRL